MTTDLTVTQLVDALQKSKAQGITIFANGGGYVVGARWTAPAFRSLPQLQRFVDEINGSSPSPGGEGRGEGGLSAQTITANAS